LITKYAPCVEISSADKLRIFGFFKDPHTDSYALLRMFFVLLSITYFMVQKLIDAYHSMLAVRVEISLADKLQKYVLGEDPFTDSCACPDTCYA